DLVIEYQTRNHVTSNSNSDDQVKAMDEILVAVNESDVTPSPILDEEIDEENNNENNDTPSLISGSESDHISDGSDENITPGTAGAYVAEQEARLESKLRYEISFTGRKITVEDSDSGLDTSGVMEDSGHIVWNGRYVAGSGASSNSGGNGTSGNSSGNGDGSSSGGSSSPIVGIHPETYGKYVDIGVDINGDNNTTNDFRVFLNDGSNVYLIAADYVSSVPYGNGNTGHAMTAGNTSYKYYWNSNTLGDYSGSSDIVSNFSSQLSTYHKWVNNNQTGTYASKTNVKATAYTLDKTAWNYIYKTNNNSSYVDYVVGGPTLEQFAASYNAVHTTTADQIFYSESGNTGYYVKKGAAPTTEIYDTFSTADNNLYFITSTSKASGAWLASPSAYREDCVMDAGYIGIVGSNDYSYNRIGLRPLVSLKSGISLADSNSDGVYDFN
ncbi:MAG: hypothetical protein IKF52_00800, partial [Clostridia bacterium]|nr:hypothetical protein [Clostridia bacterium]